jgi:hypothetical protein
LIIDYWNVRTSEQYRPVPRFLGCLKTIHQAEDYSKNTYRKHMKTSLLRR